MIEREITEKMLLERGILDRYHTASLQKYRGPSKIKDKITNYLKQIHQARLKGAGIIFTGREVSQKSYLANIVAISAMACSYEVYVMSLNMLASYKYGSSEDNSLGNFRMDEASFMEVIQTDFLVIDDLCDSLQKNAARVNTLYDTLKYRDGKRLPTVITTRLTVGNSGESVATCFNAPIQDMIEDSFIHIQCPSVDLPTSLARKKELDDLCSS